jgi:hypothetical protein
MRRLFQTLLVTAALPFAVAACDSSVDDAIALARLSGDCRLNSDCSAGLVCVFERCHTECTSSRDCEQGTRCVAGEDGRSACQLPDEVSCADSGSCPGLQVCGVDVECRDGCSSDATCLPEQLCRDATCADATELNEDGGLTPSADRPPEVAPRCAFDSDCPGSALCVAGLCADECDDASDCEAEQDCEDGRCRTPVVAPAGCLRSSDCELDEMCVAGACQPVDEPEAEPECVYDSDCAKAGQHCADGSCACECATADDCGSQQQCLDECQCVAGRVLEGNISITNTQELQALSDVVEITGQLFINPTGVGQYHLPSLRKVGTFFVSSSFGAQVEIVADSLLEATVAVTCFGECYLPKLEKTGTFTFSSQTQRELELPALKEIDALSANSSPLLTRLSAPLLQTTSSFQSYNCPQLAELDLPLLTELQSFSFGSNNSLKILSLPLLTSTGSISVGTSSALEAILMPLLQSAGTINFAMNSKLTTIDLSGLEQADSVWLSDLPKLTELDLAKLTQLTTNFVLMDSGGPSVLALGALTQAERLELSRVKGVQSVSAALTQLGLLLLQETELQSLTLPLATEIDSFSLSSNAALTSLSFPELTNVVGAMGIDTSPALSSLSFPKLSNVGTAFIGGTAITNLDTFNPDLDGSLATSGIWTLSGNTLLPVCAGEALASALGVTVTQTDNLVCDCNGAVCQ